MSDASDPPAVHIKEEVDSEPWGFFEEQEADPLGNEECDAVGAPVSAVKIEVEIDIAGYDLQQPREFSDSEDYPARPFSPTTAEASFINIKNNHEYSLGMPTGQQLKCDQCDYRCTHESTLKRHIMKHTGEKPFKCDQCEYRCSRRDYLKTHLSTHTGEKPFKCDQCDYRSGHKSDFNKHLFTHTGEKPFQCDLCEYRTTRKNDLKNHQRTHTGEKPFKCDRCEFRFSRIDNLKSHLKIHMAEKRFRCDQCEYRCNRSAHLKAHLRTHTGEKSEGSVQIRKVTKTQSARAVQGPMQRNPRGVQFIINCKPPTNNKTISRADKE